MLDLLTLAGAKDIFEALSNALDLVPIEVYVPNQFNLLRLITL